MGFGQNSEVPRLYTIPTDLRNKPVRHLFYRMGPKIRKKDQFSVFSILPDAWKNHASGNYRTHGYEKNHASVITRTHDF